MMPIEDINVMAALFFACALLVIAIIINNGDDW
jgi:hypothetical protein